jgi:uncharacterized repeat protein (TIGR01451 family)
LQLTTKCVALAPAAVNRATVTAVPAGRAEAEANIEIRGLPAFRLNVTDRDDPLEVGRRTVYTIEVTNEGTLPGSRVEVVAEVPRQMRFVAATGPAVYTVEGSKVKFAALDGLAPRQTWTYTVEVTALEPGDARFQVELRSSSLTEPVVVQQSTRLLPPASPGDRAPAAR